MIADARERAEFAAYIRDRELRGTHRRGRNWRLGVFDSRSEVMPHGLLANEFIAAARNLSSTSTCREIL
jgi:hypothetical protein